MINRGGIEKRQRHLRQPGALQQRKGAVAKSVVLADSRKTCKRRSQEHPFKGPTSVAKDSPFVHEPLRDPERQIRLLQIHPGSGDGDDPISLELSTWNIEHAPEYDAISYAWGDIVFETILIDEKPLRVRSNCRYTLWQVRRRYRQLDTTRYVWLDSICINQSDTREKGHQVRNMWNIYRGATWVLACVGAHDEDSAEFMRLAERPLLWEDDDLYALLSDAGDTSLEGAAAPREHRPDDRVAMITTERARWLDKAFTSFANRPYWARLWVIQELAAASQDVAAMDTRIQVLCGSSFTSFNNIHTILTFLRSDPGGLERDENGGISVSQALSSPLETHIYYSFELEFKDIFRLFRSFKCADPRDRIFSLLHRARIPEALAKLIPNYELSPWELALLASEHLGVNDVTEMLQALEIDATHPRMQALIEARTSSPPIFDEDHRTEDGCAYPDTADVTGWQYGSLSEKMLSSLHDIPLGFEKHISKLVQHLDPKILHRFRERSPKALIISDKVVGLVCSETIPGDRLFEYTERNHKLLFVLRCPLDRYCFDIVGQGFLIQTKSLAELDPTLRRVEKELYLQAEPEDRIVLAGQDVTRNSGIDPSLTALRLVARPKDFASCCNFIGDNVMFYESSHHSEDEDNGYGDEVAEINDDEPSPWNDPEEWDSDDSDQDFGASDRSRRSSDAGRSDRSEMDDDD